MAKKQDDKARQICIVTVTGRQSRHHADRTTMAKANVNIIDVSQRIMEAYFVMTMACDITDATADMDKLQKQLARIAKEMDLNITFQHENIFKMMHRV